MAKCLSDNPPTKEDVLLTKIKTFSMMVFIFNQCRNDPYIKMDEEMIIEGANDLKMEIATIMSIPEKYNNLNDVFFNNLEFFMKQLGEFEE